MLSCESSQRIAECVGNLGDTQNSMLSCYLSHLCCAIFPSALEEKHKYKRTIIFTLNISRSQDIKKQFLFVFLKQQESSF